MISSIPTPKNIKDLPLDKYKTPHLAIGKPTTMKNTAPAHMFFKYKVDIAQ